MEIYLAQHGVALSQEENPERPLSPDGIAQIQATAKAICRLGLRFDVIVASTKQRSIQTAEIIAQATGYSPTCIVRTESAEPGAPPEDTLRFLEQFNNRNSILVAGHLPSLAKIASILLSPKAEASVQFDNGALCRIDVQTMAFRKGTLQWLLAPAHLRLIAR